jgi:hypothetical protein
MVEVGQVPGNEPLHTALARLDRGLTRLWVDGTAKDFAALSEFSALELLGIYRLPARHLPVLAQGGWKRLRSLSVRHARAADLSFVSRLQGLDSLMVWQSPSIVSFDGIERLAGLRRLVLSDLGAIVSLAPLAQLRDLRELELSGGVWKTQGLPPLAPLLALERLEYVNIVAAKVADGDLGPLAKLPRLARLDLAPRYFAPEELASVAAAHPFFERYLLDLDEFDNWDGATGCKRCKSRRKVMFLRRKKLLWCPSCEKDKLAALLDGFKAMVAEHRSALRSDGSQPD